GTFFCQAEDGIRDFHVTGVQTCALPIWLTFGRSPGEREMPLLQEQAWEMLIARHAIEEQYEKLGLKVTSEELKDMVWGKNIEPSLKATPIFLNESGQFDNNRVLQYLQYINALPPDHEDC